MAKKLGKKARKFAKKNLQSVLKRRRKLNSFFNKRNAPRRGVGSDVDDKSKRNNEQELAYSMRNSEDTSLDGPGSDNFLQHLLPQDDELNDDTLDSDGYLSEDPDCPYISEDDTVEAANGKFDTDVRDHDGELFLEVSKQKKRLDKLIQMDPEFAHFLERHQSTLKKYQRQVQNSDEDEESKEEVVEDDVMDSNRNKVVTSTTVDVWCWLLTEEPSEPVLRTVLLAFSDACQCAANYDRISFRRIQNAEAFTKLLTFVLSEMDGIFCKLLAISSKDNKESILRFKKAPEWKSFRPIVKSYLLACLELLHQFMDNGLLIFVLLQLRASIRFFGDFPVLGRRLVKILVQLWATDDRDLSLSSFLVMQDISSLLSSDYLDICMIRTYNAYISRCNVVDYRSIKHIEFLLNCTVEFFSLDLQKSLSRAIVSVKQLSSVLLRACKLKKKEDLKKICSWQFMYCIKLWVRFIACYFHDTDVKALLSHMIEIIRATAHLFPGLRYLPLRFKCVQMLNALSSGSGQFIPIASLVFDSLEFKKINNTDCTQDESIKFSSLLKVPKNMLKSKDFQEQCVLSAVELLSAHFAQWSFHISFPEVSTISLIFLKKLYMNTTSESLRRPVKRLIDQVDQNRSFIQKKRDEVSFSPTDQTAVESFLPLEKSGANHSFSQFYSSILQNSCVWI